VCQPKFKCWILFIGTLPLLVKCLFYIGEVVVTNRRYELFNLNQSPDFLDKFWGDYKSLSKARKIYRAISELFPDVKMQIDSIYKNQRITLTEDIGE
jgi:hypothetical protein